MEKIRLLIADDHPAFREGLARLLEEEEDLECVAKPADGMEAVKLSKELRPDVAIIDVSMPHLNGIEAVKRIRVDCPTTAILMVSGYDYESYMLAALQAGARGYMLKNRPLHELVSAIRLVRSGDTVLDLKAADTILHYLTTDDGSGKTDSGRLQTRELEVVNLVAKGMSNREIAEALFISERTVQTHLVNIFRKLGVSSRTQAVLHALKRHWLTIDNLF